MRALLAVLLMAAFITSCNSNEKSNTETSKNDSMGGPSTTPVPTPNTLSEAEKAEGWQLLFDGTTKNGWHVYNEGSDGAAWKVEDGTLHFDPSKGKIRDPKTGKDSITVGGGDITTNEEFENFHLSLEWKLNPSGNSGIIFFVKEEPKYERSYWTGLEMQVLDNNGHKDGQIEKHRAGDLYDLVKGAPEAVNPVGEWNQVEIIANNGALEFRMNGTKIVSTTLWDDNWKKMVAGSKFKQWPDFGTYKKGKIALQDHGDPVWYRNIKIKKL